MKINEEKHFWRQVILRPAFYLVLMLYSFAWFAGYANAERTPAPEKKLPLSEMDKLLQEKDAIRTERFKLIQDESVFQVQYFKPLDRLRKELDLEGSNLYAECSGGKDLKSPQYNFCAAELKRFNENVKYYNERLDALKSGLTGHKQEFASKMEGLNRKEQEADRRIHAIQGKHSR